MPPPFTTRPELRGTFGAIASTHWLASAVGMAVLERGGNAFDAAVAAGFVLQIVEPHLNGPGGEVPIILTRADANAPIVICGQGPYPAGATLEHFSALGIKQVPGTGLLPSVVPGAFDAWMLLLRDHGTWRLRDVLEYALHYAQNGFPVLPRIAASILAAKDFFAAEWPTSAAIWCPGGAVPAPGTFFSTPRIAATYRRIVAEAESAGRDRVVQIERARETFYRGFVADAVDRFYASQELMDSTGQRNRGVLCGDDLASFRATVEPTTSFVYRGLRVHKTGPWGQGPAFLQSLSLLDGFDLAALDPAGDAFVHTLVECMKLAYADREVFYGDPRFVDVPLATLLSDENARCRRALVNDTASLEQRPSALAGAADRMARVLAMAGAETPYGIGAGEPTFAPLPVEWGDTVHIDVADRFGNMLSATPSGGWLQSSPAIPELGFAISTRGQIGWLEPGHPSTVRPGARPRTTLTPTLVTRDGEAVLAIGTPGGDQQDQWTLAVFLRHVHHGLDLQAAIDAPLFTSRHWPSSFYPRTCEPGRLIVEERFGETAIAALRRRGHQITVEGPWALGRVCAVGRDGGKLSAAATPRLMQAYAIAR
ncbi:MAG TPA: gamma-glutamyltransferase family protein [Xanthobacteraceae bacterium]|nr:gamma-glutamyltransferase family protein [Xanthobacteraceae bacterium]